MAAPTMLVAPQARPNQLRCAVPFTRRQQRSLVISAAAAVDVDALTAEVCLSASLAPPCSPADPLACCRQLARCNVRR